MNHPLDGDRLGFAYIFGPGSSLSDLKDSLEHFIKVGGSLSHHSISPNIQIGPNLDLSAPNSLPVKAPPVLPLEKTGRKYQDVVSFALFFETNRTIIPYLVTEYPKNERRFDKNKPISVHPNDTVRSSWCASNPQIITLAIGRRLSRKLHPSRTQHKAEMHQSYRSSGTNGRCDWR